MRSTTKPMTLRRILVSKLTGSGLALVPAMPPLLGFAQHLGKPRFIRSMTAGAVARLDDLVVRRFVVELVASGVVVGMR